MSNLFTGGTTGGKSGKFIYEEIETVDYESKATTPERESFEIPTQEYEEVVDANGDVYELPKPVEYPANQPGPFITFEQYEAEDRKKLRHANNLVVATDEHALDLLSQINQRKQEIATLMEDLFDGINVLSPYPAVESRLISPTLNPNYLDENGNNRGSSLYDNDPLFILPELSGEIGSRVSYMTGITTFTYPPACTVPNSWMNYSDIQEELDTDGNVITPGRVNCITDLNCCLIGIKAPIYKDIMVTWKYPALENEDYEAEIWREGEKFVILKDSNTGVGKTAYTHGDLNGYTTFSDLMIDDATPIGYFYFWEDLNTHDPSAYTAVSEKINEIELIREELDEFLSNSNTGSNNLRDIRHRYLLDLRYGLQTRHATNRVFNTNRATSTLEDSEKNSIIQEYDK